MSTLTTPRPGQVAGLAPSEAEVRRGRHGRITAFVIYGIPLILLMVGMYVRLFTSADRLGLGMFTYVFPLIVVAVLAALLWALVVEPYSRGNALGVHLNGQEDVDQETVEMDREILERGRTAAVDARRNADLARSALVSADGDVEQMKELGHRGLQIAHAALGVPEVGTVREVNLRAETFPHRDRIAATVSAESARTSVAAAELETYNLPPLVAIDSPHLVYEVPADREPDLGFVVPTSIASYPESTLLDPEAAGREPVEGKPRRWVAVAVGAALVLAAAVGGVWWGSYQAAASPSAGATDTTNNATSTRTAASTASTTRTGTIKTSGLVVGRDYSLAATAASGKPVRWACASPITVRLAGSFPAGAEKSLRGAVDSLKKVTGLPLAVGSPLTEAITTPAKVSHNQIVVNYLTDAQIQRAGIDMDGDKLGQGGPRFDETTGAIQSGWVGIRSGSAETDPTTTEGKLVLWHEAAHTLNVGHAEAPQHAEIMEPTAQPGAQLAWGPGDRAALAQVGCSAG